MSCFKPFAQSPVVCLEKQVRTTSHGRCTMSKKTVCSAVLLTLLLIPATSVAKPSKARILDECRAELKVAGLNNFRDLYGAGPKRRFAVSNCVKIRRKIKGRAQKMLHGPAVRECKIQREADPVGFDGMYDSPGDDEFANCVAEQVMDGAADHKGAFNNRLVAIATCRDERAANEEEFLAKYRRIARRLKNKGKNKGKQRSKRRRRPKRIRAFTACVIVKSKDGKRDGKGDDPANDAPDNPGSDRPPDDEKGNGSGDGHDENEDGPENGKGGDEGNNGGQ